MKLHVQEFLITEPFSSLAARHGVYASFSSCRRKVSLNYDQIESKESDPLARQCRGLILARAGYERFDGSIDSVPGETVIVARPFDRFFNHGQHGMDASTLLSQMGTRVFEKLDGTLCIVYFDRFQDRWHVATRAVPEADKAIDGFGTHTFASLFEHALKEHLNLTLERLGEHLYKSCTYMFELTTPHNRIVVEYDRPKAHLLAIRDNVTGQELCPLEWPIRGISVPHAPHKLLHGLADLIGYVTSRSPSESEGVVVRSADFTRVKVKNPAYVALNGLRHSVANSPRRLMEVVLLGKEDDVFPMLPADVAATGEGYRTRYATMARSYDAVYSDLAADAAKTENPRKSLALSVQERKGWMPFFMERFTGKACSFKDFVEQKRDKTGSWPDGFLDNLLNNLPEAS